MLHNQPSFDKILITNYQSTELIYWANLNVKGNVKIN